MILETLQFPDTYVTHTYDVQAGTVRVQGTVKQPYTSARPQHRTRACIIYEGAVPAYLSEDGHDCQQTVGLPWLPQPVPLGQNDADSPLKHAPVHS